MKQPTFSVIFALSGFAIAASLMELLAGTPEFLVARQNTAGDVVALALTLTVGLPLALALPGWLVGARLPRLATGYWLTVATALSAAFYAQLQPLRGLPTAVFLAVTLVLGLATAWVLLYTRWKLLAPVLALLVLVFPLRLLFFSTVLAEVRGQPQSTFVLPGDLAAAPDIVFVLLDEFSISTLLDEDLRIDQRYFPGFDRLARMSDWYVDAIAISDNTIDSVPSIVTGLNPGERALQPTIAEQPANLFTLLRPHYRFNVAETVTRMCPADKCPRVGPGPVSRFNALQLDLAAVYLHRVVPQAWRRALPDVDHHWSGFFAQRQLFFPGGWLDYAGAQTLIDRLGFFRRFIASVKPGEARPVLHFIHILFPHDPLVYLPDGSNYGYVWLRALSDGVWQDHDWGIVSGKQRNFLQVQLADRLMDELLDRMQATGMLERSVLVVVADHGASFEPGQPRRTLTDGNVASLLRVPLFIKASGQTRGRRITDPVTVTDILPTLLSLLGADAGAMQTDGRDLSAGTGRPDRPRHAWRSASREKQAISAQQADVVPIVARDRQQLRLADPTAAIWGIGPYGDQRGQPVSAVCQPEPIRLRYVFDRTKPLPATDPDNYVPAYISGTVVGRDAPDESLPFLISSRGMIAASGFTWKFNDRWRFFALVEPRRVRQPDWAPEISLVRDGRCLEPT